jgi:membrane-associated PAP2 superfamily phosphatase
MPLNESRLLGNAPLSNAPFAPRFLITHLALPAGAALIISSLLMDGGGDFWVADHLYRLQGSRWALRDAWLTSNLLHRGGKNLSTFLAIAVAATCIWAWRKNVATNARHTYAGRYCIFFVRT